MANNGTDDQAGPNGGESLDIPMDESRPAKRRANKNVLLIAGGAAVLLIAVVAGPIVYKAFNKPAPARAVMQQQLPQPQQQPSMGQMQQPNRTQPDADREQTLPPPQGSQGNPVAERGVPPVQTAAEQEAAKIAEDRVENAARKELEQKLQEQAAAIATLTAQVVKLTAERGVAPAKSRTKKPAPKQPPKESRDIDRRTVARAAGLKSTQAPRADEPSATPAPAATHGWTLRGLKDGLVWLSSSSGALVNVGVKETVAGLGEVTAIDDACVWFGKAKVCQ